MSKQLLLKNKISGADEAHLVVRSWQTEGQKVVFTNGVFDILHAGHIDYLARAAELGDHLVIGVNSDLSVKTLGKGDNRPINNEKDRCILLASLVFVDMVVLFSENTPYELILKLNPDVLVKGGDYDAEADNPKQKEYIIGSDIVRKKGGLVISVPLLRGYSTTGLIEKIVNSK